MMPPQEEPPPDPAQELMLLPDWLVDQIARRQLEREQAMATKMAEFFGPPPGHVEYTLEDQLLLWRATPKHLSDPEERHRAMWEMQEAGKSPTEIRDAVWPLRAVMLKMASSEPTGQVRYAARMQQLDESRLADLPDPEEPFAASDDESDYDEQDDFFDFSLVKHWE